MFINSFLNCTTILKSEKCTVCPSLYSNKCFYCFNCSKQTKLVLLLNCIIFYKLYQIFAGQQPSAFFFPMLFVFSLNDGWQGEFTCVYQRDWKREWKKTVFIKKNVFCLLMLDASNIQINISDTVVPFQKLYSMLRGNAMGNIFCVAVCKACVNQKRQIFGLSNRGQVPSSDERIWRLQIGVN